VDIVQEDIEDICRRVGEPLHALANASLLVAGGGGFLPSYFLDVVAYANEFLLEHPCRLLCVDNFITGVPARVEHLRDRPYFHFLHHDITQPLATDEPIDYVIHGASIASPPVYRKYPLQTVDVNVLGTRNLLELSHQKRVRSFLYMSSSEVYGDPPASAIPTTETYRGNVSPLGPRACYDESKRLAEALCMIYFHEYGVPVKVVRPFNVYGPRLRLDDGRIIPDLLREALQGKPLTLYSDGKATRSFCYIGDAVTASLLLLLSAHNGEVFNVGNDQELSIESLAREVIAVVGERLEVRFGRHTDAQYLADSPRRRCPDLTKIKRAIGWAPVTGLHEGLQRTVQWYRERKAIECE
jgi:dTDP-glucose 4,6-dehydratase/UDP-glucuronate decarboxylase